VVLYGELTKALQVAAVRRSLNYVFSVTSPRPMRVVVRATAETVALKPVPAMILPRPIIEVADELSAVLMDT